MKRVVFSIIVSGLTYVALTLIIGFATGMALWVTVGDTHEEMWNSSRYIVIVLAALLSLIWLWLDLRGSTSHRSHIIRFWAAFLICIFAFSSKVYDEIHLFKGWGADSAALGIATVLYPTYAGDIVLQIESKNDINSFGRGPSVVYLALHGPEVLCRIGVSRRWWSYWTCGMYETLKPRFAQQGVAPYVAQSAPSGER